MMTSSTCNLFRCVGREGRREAGGKAGGKGDTVDYIAAYDVTSTRVTEFISYIVQSSIC